LLLFTAARHEIWKQAQEQLAKGTWVVAARNYFSTLAYQGYGEGLDHDLILRITEEFTDKLYMHPDYAIILSLGNEAERAKRIEERGDLNTPDTFESRNAQFQEAVEQGYLAVAAKYNLPIIPATGSKEAIAKRIYDLIDVIS
jgi:dTMP kinase